MAYGMGPWNPFKNPQDRAEYDSPDASHALTGESMVRDLRRMVAQRTSMMNGALLPQRIRRTSITGTQIFDISVMYIIQYNMREN